MNYPVFPPIKKIVTTDIQSYYVVVDVDMEENGVYVRIYEYEHSGFFIKYRKLLASEWYPVHDNKNVEDYIAELLRKYEKPFRKIRRFEKWDGHLDLSKEPDAKEDASQTVVNKVNINGKDIIGAFFDNLTRLVKPEEKAEAIPIYDWEESLHDDDKENGEYTKGVST
jgi:hypothetical protein